MKRNQIFPSKWLAAGDLPDEGQVVTIRSIETEKMRGGDEKPIIYFDEFQKGMVCNVTNWRLIECLYGDESDDWVDERVTLYPSETTFDQEVVACIRVRNKKPKPTIAPAKGNGAAKAKVQPMTQAEIDKPENEDADVPY